MGEGTEYAEFILNELTGNKQFVDNILQIKIGDLEVRRVWPWMKGSEYPKRIELDYGVKSPYWQLFTENVTNNKEVVKKYRVSDEKQNEKLRLLHKDSNDNSIPLEVEFARNYIGHSNAKLSATVIGTTKATMIDGIETVMDLSVPFEIKVTPFMKTPKTAFDYYGKFNIRKEVEEMLA